MNDALCRGAWDKGCTDVMYMALEYPNYPIISLLTQPRGNCVNVLRLRNSTNPFGTWTRILSTATQCITIELRRPYFDQSYLIPVNLLFVWIPIKKYIFRIHIFIVLCSPYKDNKMRSIILFSCCLLDQILLLFIKF